MTITLELTPDQEARIEARARALGIDPAEYLLRMVDDLPSPHKGLLPGETLLDGMKRIGVVAAYTSKPRADGRAWSECEGFE